LKTKTKNIKEKKGLSVTSDKNPNQYNGEILDDQNSRIKNSKQVYIESYGCSMNFADSEVVASILSNEGFQTTAEMKEADLVLINTCSIRDKAEQTVRKRLEKFNAIKRVNPKMKVGV
jgi:tRNA-2-methylthio-N6-dimethylallyladenosine synthase